MNLTISFIESKFNKSNEELHSFKEDNLSQVAMSSLLAEDQQFDIFRTCLHHKEAFCTTEEPIGNSKGHDIKGETAALRYE
ncbi:hypothetical protein Pst134EA_030515 [Puccinia striiformis f. sp. tritici]|uniref:hypothetical protein n=1 Tax=Puccinia striiformis f. sp. tritici TaxID=168172 RepID=UPI0020075167|nr:hypothetical protein Pst134EA_030515 [Puccinia striiformis f. sp. tritici]KAH9440445.1 hypothetical protein Pst134EB_031057 [Puccinia striiformis f. sp. tritici]KAH9446604.1 hypothetical protein Pst134EA_030515 [Puccinia striiformis f. sp. tritici]